MFVCRGGPGHDFCDRPGDGNVLGDVSLERCGDHGELKMKNEDLTIHPCSHPLITSFPSLYPSGCQEAYSIARQFNLVPPVCEQAEYHYFQRDKVELHLPELYHKIGTTC